MKVKFGGSIFMEDEWNKAMEAIKEVNPVLAFEIEGYAVFRGVDPEIDKVPYWSQKGGADDGEA